MSADKLRGGTKWTPEEKTRLIELLRSEISLEDIATAMQRSERGVTLQIRNMVAVHHSAGSGHLAIARACGLSIEDVDTIVESLEARLEDRVADLEREMEELKKTVIALQHRK